MVPEIKLTYFDIRGRAEPIRLALTIGEIPFEDDRISFSQWKDVKPKTPYGSLPIMTVDGKVAVQSGGLLRYAGKLTGLYPSDPLAALKVDELLDTLGDLSAACFRYRGKDKDRLREEREKMVKEDVPRYFGGLEKRLEVFGGAEYAVGDSLTVADLALVNLMINVKSGLLDYVPKDILDGYSRASGIYENLMKHPKVAAWYEMHPIKFN